MNLGPTLNPTVDLLNNTNFQCLPPQIWHMIWLIVTASLRKARCIWLFIRQAMLSWCCLLAVSPWRWGHSQRGNRRSELTSWQKVLQDPERHERYKAALRERMRRLRAKRSRNRAGQMHKSSWSWRQTKLQNCHLCIRFCREVNIFSDHDGPGRRNIFFFFFFKSPFLSNPRRTSVTIKQLTVDASWKKNNLLWASRNENCLWAKQEWRKRRCFISFRPVLLCRFTKAGKLKTLYYVLLYCYSQYVN